MSAGDDSPKPWALRGCNKHQDRTDLPCYRVRDAKGEIVLGSTLLARVQELETANLKLVDDGARIIAAWENKSREQEALLRQATHFSFLLGRITYVPAGHHGPEEWRLEREGEPTRHYPTRDAAVEAAGQSLPESLLSRGPYR